jgi:hypothetical protein
MMMLITLICRSYCQFGKEGSAAFRDYLRHNATQLEELS